MTGRPYLWATELENVHTLWRYGEPEIVIDGMHCMYVEDYFHSPKPHSYNDTVWCAGREDVMEKRLKAKLEADPGLRTLLLSTAPHPLLLLKRDRKTFLRSCGRNCERSSC